MPEFFPQFHASADCILHPAYCGGGGGGAAVLFWPELGLGLYAGLLPGLAPEVLAGLLPDAPLLSDPDEEPLGGLV